MAKSSRKSDRTIVNSRPYRGQPPLLTEEEQVWWRGSYPHPVRILLWRLASEREKAARLRGQHIRRIEGRNG